MEKRREFLAGLAAFLISPSILRAGSKICPDVVEYVSRKNNLKKLDFTLSQYYYTAFSQRYDEGLTMQTVPVEEEVKKVALFTSYALETKIKEPPIPKLVDFPEKGNPGSNDYYYAHYNHLGRYDYSAKGIELCKNIGRNLFDNVYSHELTHYVIDTAGKVCHSFDWAINEGIARCAQEVAMERMTRLHGAEECVNIVKRNIFDDLYLAYAYFAPKAGLKLPSWTSKVFGSKSSYPKDILSLNDESTYHAIGTAALKIMQSRHGPETYLEIFNADKAALDKILKA